MKAIIITISVHHGNTRKIADAMAEVLGAEVVAPNKITPEQLDMYDLVGFGSGIYFRKHHESIFRLLDRLPDMHGKKAFVFSTAGVRLMQKSFHRPLQERLRAKGFTLAGDFCCKGRDTYAIFGLIGGINRNHPDDKDIAAAKAFAEGLKKE